MSLNMTGLDFSYGDSGNPILKGWSMDFQPSNRYVFLGPSGCGKTTLLGLAAGLLEAQAGEITGNRQVSYLFQEPRLIPQKSVYTNLELPLLPFMDKAQRLRAIQDMLELVGLSKYQQRFPRELSGGMEQRVAMARAFLFPSDILLMDEPFKGLDPQLRQRLLILLKNLLDRKKPTLLAVTHRVDEAVIMGDEILLTRGTPLAIEKKWNNPLARREGLHRDVEFLELEAEILDHCIGI